MMRSNVFARREDAVEYLKQFHPRMHLWEIVIFHDRKLEQLRYTVVRKP